MPPEVRTVVRSRRFFCAGWKACTTTDGGGNLMDNAQLFQSLGLSLDPEAYTLGAPQQSGPMTVLPVFGPDAGPAGGRLGLPWPEGIRQAVAGHRAALRPTWVRQPRPPGAGDLPPPAVPDAVPEPVRAARRPDGGDVLPPRPAGRGRAGPGG